MPARHAATPRLFLLAGSVRRDAAVAAWLDEQPDDLGAIARHWFDVIRGCGADVRELLHDDAPTACVADAAFAYVDAFTAHVNVGFFNGAGLPDPAGVLQGTGKYMRHVKLRVDDDVDADALVSLIESAYEDVKRRMRHA